MRNLFVSLLSIILLFAAVADSQTPRRPGQRVADDPHRLISAEAMIEVVEELVSIRAYQGFRTAATPGEAEALDLVATRFERMRHLATLGLEIESQSFRVPFGLIPHESRVWFRIDGIDHGVPASASAKDFKKYSRAILDDSDGFVGDEEPNPVSVTGEVVFVGSVEEMEVVSAEEASGRVLVLRSTAIDYVGSDYGDYMRYRNAALRVIDLDAAAIVLITEFSDQPGESHGTQSTRASLQNMFEDTLPPRLVIRIEDLEALGITCWNDLQRVEAASVRWDADVISPGTSGNLIVTIPGHDRRRSVVLGAHIDSANTPGALDDGSGVAVLLEIARVIDRARMTPPVDLVLSFFGSEEGGLFGSAHFVMTHEELLDQTLAMLQVDCLTSPIDGVPRALALDSIVPAVFEDDDLPWPEYLASIAQQRDLWPIPSAGFLGSDNMLFQGFDVPNANLIAWDPELQSSAHYGGHLHDPYDDMDRLNREIDTLVDMAHVALGAALETGVDDPFLRKTPAPDRRAVIVASHTEVPHMSPAGGLQEFGMTLAWAGYDVDVVPYGTPVTGEHLVGTDLVMVMPVIDYPVPETGDDSYDEAWNVEEIDVLESYVENGGLLLLTHARGMMLWGNWALSEVTNEDASDDNALAERFGIRFDVEAEPFQNTSGIVVSSHPVVADLDSVILGYQTGTSIEHSGMTLVESFTTGVPVVASIERGIRGGEVLALGDLGLLSNDGQHFPARHNLSMWLQLADYARNRARP